MKAEIVAGIQYFRPTVTLLRESGIGVSEVAARTCYDSFDKSENGCIRDIPEKGWSDEVNEIESSDLLMNLAWVHHHHSILEHTYLSYLIEGTSRGVLQEHARHRLQNISVRSTRYTMGTVVNAFLASLFGVAEDGERPLPRQQKQWFAKTLCGEDLLVVAPSEKGSMDYCFLEWESAWTKLDFQRKALGVEAFLDLATTKKKAETIREQEGKVSMEDLFAALQDGKQKRNVGDPFKHIVTDNWKVHMVVTFNLRSLKNYFTLRNSGAAWFQIRWLAEEMISATPKKYLDLIVKQEVRK